MSSSNTLKLNGVAKPASPRNGALVIGHKEALKILLAAEVHTEFPDFIREELPAIITHWLQSTKEPPILVDSSCGAKWVSILRHHCQLREHNPASGPVRKTKHDKPVYVDFSDLPFPPQLKPKFTFIDLFAGIGGFRIGLESLGGKCVFTSEWERHAKETYYSNYGEVPFGDITNFTKTGDNHDLNPERIPEHDILCAGFPCQPFSQAGRQLGFEDARGTLFFDILTIAKTQRPKVLFLENVKRLKGHDKGRTFRVICNALHEIGYKVYAKVLRAYDHGVPQNRERIFIVAFSEPIEFEFPKITRHSVYSNVGEVLEAQPDCKYTISDRMWAGHKRRLEQHRTKGNGFGYSLFDSDDSYVNTISARYWKDGSEILINQEGKNPRVLTPRECARIQGYPENFQFHESKRHAYQQFGNSVAVPVIMALAKQIKISLDRRKPANELDPLQPRIF
jgi:DNA (cytosine-5)-methyltransferase 1